ncbi:phosphoadenosine phosphosulfate reductase family protein [bacterium]|nr:phosphoadenosine phosphosulfate reductase family protein [bacterium]
MATRIKHLLGISGGKDSAALALYMHQRHPELSVEYYTCDTGKELKETYELIDRLESVLGKPIERYHSFEEGKTAIDNPFDHFLASYGNYLPSSIARWCTKKMKLEPFEQHVGDEPTISYVGIRGDEHREGYVSKRENIQTLFPFRKNIWSEDVQKLAVKDRLDTFKEGLKARLEGPALDKALSLADAPLGLTFTLKQKTKSLVDFDTVAFNHAIHHVLKGTDYPVGKLDAFPLLDNAENLIIDDIYNILESSGVGIPAYYLPATYTVDVDGKQVEGTYSRSRSGCFFCFYQQKIEWVWLLEQHPDLYTKAKEYEKDGYTWSEEPLTELEKPERVANIKRDHWKRTQKAAAKGTTSWKDQVMSAEGQGCTSCFI